MRIFELTATVALIAYLLGQLSPHRDGYPWLSGLLFLCIPIVVLHGLLEGARWQMLPIYVVFILGLSWEAARQWTMDTQAQYVVCWSALCCVGIGVLLSTIFPVFELPSPTGPNPVGTSIRHLVDGNRSNSADPPGPRELMVQIWYPADRSFKGKLAQYQQRETTVAWDARFSLVRTHSMIDATMAGSETRYPVLLYVPSWNGMRTENTHLAEQLASQGYVVVGIDHPYGSYATVLPDGHVINSKLLDEDFYATEASFDRFLKTAETEIRTRADDARFVVDALEELDAAGPAEPFAHRLNLNRVGIFGFSLGGGVAAQTCWLDRRFKACVNMDGLMACESLEHGAIAPLFFMSETDPVPTDGLEQLSPSKRREKALDWEQFAQARKLFSTFGGYWLTIKPSKHFNFSDYVFSSPVHFFSRSGAIDPTKAARTIDKYVFAFFELYLRGRNQPLLDEPVRDSAEIRFEKVALVPERQ